jgi:hypothetical protein
MTSIAFSRTSCSPIHHHRLVHTVSGESEMQGLVLPFLLWLLITFAYIMSPVVTSFDSRFVVLQAVSLLRHGDLNLDEYRLKDSWHLLKRASIVSNHDA